MYMTEKCMTQKNCILVTHKIYHKISKPCITPEPWNRQHSTEVIFEDTKHIVVGLFDSPKTIISDIPGNMFPVSELMSWNHHVCVSLMVCEQSNISARASRNSLGLQPNTSSEGCKWQVQLPLTRDGGRCRGEAGSHIDGLVQACSNSNTLAVELLQYCTKPSIFACSDQTSAH